MKNWSFAKKFFVIVTSAVLVIAVIRFFIPEDKRDSRLVPLQNEILHLEMNGVIMNGKKFIENLKKYTEEKSVKAVLIDINSPGGAVGPSQELYYEILRIKEKTKKPFICVATSLIASGAYYAAMACDKLLVMPGAMVGSIGVIMEFANLEGLYDWAKVKRYTIKSGKFKDSGSEYRAMRDDERELFQTMIDEVYNQFKETVMKGRKLDEETVLKYADGRVMTGARAVDLKFADAIGTFEDAVEMAAAAADISNNYKLFKPRKADGHWYEYLLDRGEEEDDLNALKKVTQFLSSSAVAKGDLKIDVAGAFKKILKTEMMNQPMYLLPGYWE